jgi:hypothetical protein
MELSGEVIGGRFFTGVDGIQFASRPAAAFLSEMGERRASGGAPVTGSEGVKGTKDAPVTPPDSSPDPSPEAGVYLLNACDPASPCGLGIDMWDRKLPQRIPSNHIIFRRSAGICELLLVSRRNGREVEFLAPPPAETQGRAWAEERDESGAGEDTSGSRAKSAAEEQDGASALEAPGDTFTAVIDALVLSLSRAVDPPHRLRIEKINGKSSKDSPYRSLLEEFGFRADHKGLVFHR